MCYVYSLKVVNIVKLEAILFMQIRWSKRQNSAWEPGKSNSAYPIYAKKSCSQLLLRNASRLLCLAYISRLKPTKVFVWQYNNKRQKLRYRVHYATKVFDARTLHDSTKVLVHSDPSVVVVANYEHAARSCG